MAKGNYITVVATACTNAADEARFNEWYNNNHVPILMKNKDVKKVTRYKINGEAPAGGTYLAIYEYESAEARAAEHSKPPFAEAMAEMQQSWPNGGVEIKWVGAYDPIKSWEQ